MVVNKLHCLSALFINLYMHLYFAIWTAQEHHAIIHNKYKSKKHSTKLLTILVAKIGLKEC